MTRIKKLEQRLQVANQTTQPQSTVKIVVGSIVIGLLTIGLLF
jgi:hypothetical protein